MKSFADANLPQPLFHRLEQLGFDEPTPIQQQAIPLALEGKDILGSAQTGTGKTGAYGIPLATKLISDLEGESAALVLLPTRELAAQVMDQLKKFVGRGKIKTALLIGGEGMPRQLSQLKAGARLIVGTPGRVNDHLSRKSLKLHNVNYFVLDEVDRMLDMGFGVQLEAIAEYLTSEERQTLMFSATLPNNIKQLSGRYLSDPVRVSVGNVSRPAQNVKQSIKRVESPDKFAALTMELQSRDGTVIVFVKTKYSADRIAEKLRKREYRAEALHGDLKQGKRNRITADYRDKMFDILIATDVAARGLDISHIEHVINYDLPQCPEDYIHRIGRTARGGAKGEAITFLSSEDSVKWRGILRLLDPELAEELNVFGDGASKKKPHKKKEAAKQRRFGFGKGNGNGKSSNSSGFKGRGKGGGKSSQGKSKGFKSNSKKSGGKKSGVGKRK